MQSQPPPSSAIKFIERRRKNEWRCLLCCHVRTGTIFLGLWHLMLQLLAISTMGVVLRHPDLLKITRTLPDPNELPTALAERNMPSINDNAATIDGSTFSNYEQDDGSEPDERNGHYYTSATYGMYVGRPIRYGKKEINVALFLIFCTLTITIVMIYGAIKGKPKLLIPFFSMQLFDLLVTTLSTLGYLCYLPEFHRLVIRTESTLFPAVSSIDSQYISLIIIFCLVFSVISKGYFVAVVWSCYRYLTLKRASAQPTIHYIESNFVVQNLLRPDYDFNMKKFPPPPPSYAVAVGEDTAGHSEAPPPSYSSN
ncbi:Hypothetical protein CINCED_3A008877 [Cinara cedri]|uniref:Lysosomal-associated transmembrane protein 4A n=1 Tax=Cinara cedri TaxID=506608 RepID=A0A5E4MIT3_9HEMI|nr:Hypothetical protein CINCED_3A008877 [Cinara cedri]